MDEICTINALRLIEAAGEFKARLSGDFAAVHGLSVNEFVLLLHLDRAQAKRLSRVELSRRMHISASTVTRMASPMQKIGLVGRQSDDRDARLAFVVITQAGQTKLTDARATFAKHAERLFSDRWAQSELTELAGLLQRLIGAGPASLT